MPNPNLAVMKLGLENTTNQSEKHTENTTNQSEKHIEEAIQAVSLIAFIL